MAVANGYGKVATLGSVFMYDTGDIVNSYIGEPTTNLALFSVISGITFNADYGGTISQTADYTITYKGRPSLKIVSTSQWNIYKYPRPGNYTATSSTAFTFSWKMKWSDARVPILNNGYIYTDAQYFYPSVTVTAIEDGWYFCQCSTSGTDSPLWLTGFDCSQTGTCYITDWQAEAKSHATPYTTGTRSSTQGLLPLVGDSTINLSNVSFNSNAQIIFDGTDDFISLPPSIIPTNQITIEFVCTNNSPGNNNSIIAGGAGGNQDLSIHLPWGDGNVYWDCGRPFNRISKATTLAERTGVHHWVFTKNPSTGVMNIYLDGNLWHTGTGLTSTMPSLSSVSLGRYDNGGFVGFYYHGTIPVTKVYNREISAAEVKQNYNKYKTRFNLP
jgi:hypothetical protein